MKSIWLDEVERSAEEKRQDEFDALVAEIEALMADEPERAEVRP